MNDVSKLLAQSLYAFADLLDSLDEAQLDTPSLCEGWRVRDVAGHICTGATMTIPAVLKETAKAGFNIDRASKAGAIAWADTHSAVDMADTLRNTAAIYANDEPKRGMLRLLKPADLVVDNLIHSLDIRRPLGLSSDVPSERLHAALRHAPNVKGFLHADKRAKGLRFEATDVDWSWGSGATVSGTGEAILLALGGRPVALAELSGDGVATLTGRL